VRAFSFFGVPQSILYDNTKRRARILGDGKRQRTRVFSELQSHYLFEDRFGRPGKGNDKGKVEGLVGYARRNFLVPIPVFDSFEALNAYLLDCCRTRMGDRLRGHRETIGERLERDLAELRKPLPPPYDACEKLGTSVSSLSLVRYRRNDYSVPTSYGHREVIVRGYVHDVVIACGTEVVARHRRSYERRTSYSTQHHLRPDQRKISARPGRAAGWLGTARGLPVAPLVEARMGKQGKREFVQVLRPIEAFKIRRSRRPCVTPLREVPSASTPKHLVLCWINASRRTRRRSILSAEPSRRPARAYLICWREAAHERDPAGSSCSPSQALKLPTFLRE
jgi:hypothetical protein